MFAIFTLRTLNIFLHHNITTMSSFQRAHAAPTETTKYKKITTPSYYDSVLDATVPIPFIYSNNTLDVDIRDDVQDDLIDDGDSPDFETEYQCVTMGGTGLVLELGPKMKEWLNNWLNNNYGGDYDTNSCQVHNSGIVTKAQFVLENNADGTLLESDIDDSTYAITDAMPIGKYSSNFVYGNNNNKYHTTWIFRSPLVISFTVNDATKYLTLNTNFNAWGNF